MSTPTVRHWGLLGVGSVEELRATHSDRFAVEPPDLEEQEAVRRAYFASRADGLLAEIPFRRLDGENVRVRVAIVEEDDGRFRALFYPIERPATDLRARVYRIADVLSEWRAAERRLVELDPEDDEARRLSDQIALLRDQHSYLFDRKRKRPAGS